jgi:endonuclease YncB( thermonuclease family)
MATLCGYTIPKFVFSAIGIFGHYSQNHRGGNQMPFTLIKGEFVPEAGRPDGDSMRFRPDDPTPLFMLKRRGRAPKINENNGTIQLRFEGIDTMESKAAQPFSSNATKSNLELCGVSDGVGTARGYILSNQIGPNGRPIAFVYLGDPAEPDGANVFLDSDRMKESVNYQQLERGHAFPLFYDTLFGDLRKTLAEQVGVARAAAQNVWTSDVTNVGATYSGPNSLATMPPFFPKLWRRLDTYSRDSDIADRNSLSEFRDYLESLREERVFIASESRATGFDDVIQIDGNTVKMMCLPEDLIVMSV